MTDQEIRIAIAEACGWKNIIKVDGTWWASQIPDSSPAFPLPDYLNDLNAMHEAEKALSIDQQVEYSAWLGRLVTSHLPSSRAAWMDYSIAHATASQRAESFLRTLNLWES